MTTAPTKIIVKTINDEKVERIPIKIDTRKVKGADICKDCYSNIFCVAPTNCGKTTAIFSMLKAFAGKNTKILLFVSTIYNDPNWQFIRKYFEKKGNDVICQSSLREDGIDHLKELVEHLKEKAQEREAEEESDDEPDLMKILEQENGVINYLRRDEDKPKKKKEKYQSPEYILVADDLADEIKSPTFTTLLKKARHYHIKVIISSQYLKDLIPAARKQIRLWLIFMGCQSALVYNIHEASDLRIDPELFLQLYQKATIPTDDNPKPFLYVAPREDDFRISFSKRFILPEGTL